MDRTARTSRASPRAIAVSAGTPFIAGVLIDLPRDDVDRRRSFYDSTRIAHAVEYLRSESCARAQLDALPVSINISLGTNGHAHDGSSAVSRWLEHVLTIPGRCDLAWRPATPGRSAPRPPDDIGFIMGRIHTERHGGRPPGSPTTSSWMVVGNGTIDVSENELEIWYSPAGPVRGLGQAARRRVDRAGRAAGSSSRTGSSPTRRMVSVYNEIYHPANGSNYIGDLSDARSSRSDADHRDHVGALDGAAARRSRCATAAITAGSSVTTRAELGRARAADGVALPVLLLGAVATSTSSSVSSLGLRPAACSASRNLDELRAARSTSRAARVRPATAGSSRTSPRPGTDIVAAFGFNFDDDEHWIAMTGTSMASPLRLRAWWG